MKTEVISLFILVIVSGTTYSSEVNINKQVKCEGDMFIYKFNPFYIILSLTLISSYFSL